MTNKKHAAKFQFNIGFVVFFIIFVYLTITVIANLMKDTVSVCRVEEGQIVNSATFTGICLRDEEVIYASNNGYVYFYVGEGDKVAKGGKVYLLSENPPSEAETALSESTKSVYDWSEIRDQISVYTKNFSEDRYEQIYSLKYTMQSLATEMISDSAIQNFEINSQQGKISVASSSGIVSYCYDGLENLAINEINKKILYDTTSDIYQINPYIYVQEGQPAYKLVHGHTWQIVIPLTDEQEILLDDVDSVNITFSKDNIETNADFYIYNGSDGKYGVLTLDDYMIRYITDRYIDFEIVFTEAIGLKIPTSALLEKDFYKIPIEYLVEDERSYQTGFFCEHINDEGERVADFCTSGIYYQDDEFFYVSTEDFELGDYIGKVNVSESDERFQIGATGKLYGVYNVNKGYTQFKIVHVLHKNSDYCIVQKNLNYSVALYDNIVLNSDSVKEGQIIY